MSTQSTLTRQRLIQAALELFVSQGVSNTTTRQIANLADVNEVTLFRHFGNKYGLLLAVIEESITFTNLGDALIQRLQPVDSIHDMLIEYVSISLQLLEQIPEFVQSVIGEAEQYPDDNRQALGRRLSEMNHEVAQYLASMIPADQRNPNLPAEHLIGLLNAIIIGYAVIRFTSEIPEIWSDRTQFLTSLEQLFLHGAIASQAAPPQSPDLNSDNDNSGHVSATGSNVTISDIAESDFTNLNASPVLDLPNSLVHNILQQARKQGNLDYALAYVLFAAGLTPTELVNLQRTHQISDSNQHILQVMTRRGLRQVPVNQWILGKRYGSYTNNPLTKWLKSRKDENPVMFVDINGKPLTPMQIQQHWQSWTSGLLTPMGKSPAIAQAHQTWCVEMLMRGVSLENLSILTGLEPTHLQSYARRAREKAALEEATLLDRKPRHNSSKLE
jgi:AcrR family transcriptional regulator